MDNVVWRLYFKDIDGAMVLVTDPAEAEYYIEQDLALNNLIPVS